MKIIPTKTNLLKLKEQLTLSKEGHKLLEQKYEILIMELMNHVYNLRSIQEDIAQNFKSGYSAITELMVDSGQLRASMILGAVSKLEDFELEIGMKSVMGVPLPVVNFDEVHHKKVDTGIFNTSPKIDTVVDDFDKIANILAKYAEIYITIWRLIREIKKTKRRVNALENMFIPDYRENIKNIESVLEESEREEFFKRKLVKRKKENER